MSLPCTHRSSVEVYFEKTLRWLGSCLDDIFCKGKDEKRSQQGWRALLQSLGKLGWEKLILMSRWDWGELAGSHLLLRCLLLLQCQVLLLAGWLVVSDTKSFQSEPLSSWKYSSLVTVWLRASAVKLVKLGFEPWLLRLAVYDSGQSYGESLRSPHLWNGNDNNTFLLRVVWDLPELIHTVFYTLLDIALLLLFWTYSLP